MKIFLLDITQNSPILQPILTHLKENYDIRSAVSDSCYDGRFQCTIDTCSEWLLVYTV